MPGLRALRTCSNGGTPCVHVRAAFCGAWSWRRSLLAPAAASAYTVFVTNEKDNTVSIIDSAKLEVVKTVKVGQRPRGVILSKDQRWLLVCASDDNSVQVYDARTLELVKTLPSGQDPELFVLHPSGNPLYIANEEDNLVTVVDIEQGSVLAEIPVGVEPEGMGISPDGKVLVTTSETTSMAHFIDTATRATIDNVLVDSRPRVAEFTADGSQVWVSAEIGGTVTVIETGTRKVVAKIGFKIPGVPAGRRSAGRRAHQPATASAPSSRSVPPIVSPWSTPPPSRSRNICWSASASGSSPSRPTRSSCSPPTAPPTTCR